MFKRVLVAAAMLAACLSGASVMAQPKPKAALSPVGVWDATITVKDTQIPFRLQLAPVKGGLAAQLFDGDRALNRSTPANLIGDVNKGEAHFVFPAYAGKLDVRFENGVLQGTYGALPVEARPHRAVTPVKGPSIAGVWEIPTDSPKGEKAWRLIVSERGGEDFATILRIDGDTGTLNGRFDGVKFRLSRFAGERPGLLELTPRKDGGLSVAFYDNNGRHDYQAVREAEARRRGLAPPTDPTQQTSVTDRNEGFHFKGVDLNGKTVTQDDPRFRGKVVLVNVMGSWCPNCHDEAPFLAELDAKYRAKGLQIVALDFEQPEQLKTLDRLKAFIGRYGLRYTVLVAGEPKEVNAKLPQAVNLNAWPTTFFLGKDGKVRSVHVGFPSRGSGPYDLKARADINREIETLLAQAA